MAVEPHSPVLRVAGIDWATEATHRALVVLHTDLARRRITVAKIVSPLVDHSVVRTTQDQAISAIGVDIPFGWPRSFVRFVGEWSPSLARRKDLVAPAAEHFRYRTTDLVVQRTLGKWPLSVSSDRIALGAFAWARLVDRNGLHEHIDCGAGRPGELDPTILEVYPAATLAAWGETSELATEGYKNDHEVRFALLRSLFERFNVECSPEDAATLASTGKDSDKTDAFIAALTALAYMQELGGSVCRPSREQLEAAQQEGWIFFPT